MTETHLRQRMARLARSLFERGLTSGSTGNISVRLDDGWLMTPTGSSMGEIDPDRLSRLDSAGRHVGGDAPTKEATMHMAMYEERPRAGAVVHLHSTSAVAVSCLSGLDPADALPPITAYHVMRVGRVPLVPYFPPGDDRLAQAVKAQAGRHHAVLMANHGPIVAGASLDEAVDASEELEETAKLFLALRDRDYRPLSAGEVAELEKRFPVRW